MQAAAHASKRQQDCGASLCDTCLGVPGCTGCGGWGSGPPTQLPAPAGSRCAGATSCTAWLSSAGLTVACVMCEEVAGPCTAQQAAL